MGERDTVILVAFGRDRPGLANAVSKYVHEHDCTILDASMKTVGSCFASIVQLAGQAQHVSRLRDEAKEWGTLNDLSITTYEDHPDRKPAPDVLRCELRVDALERAGIIDEITHVLSERGVNVHSLEGRMLDMPFTGEERFVVEAVLEMPASSFSEVNTALGSLDLNFVMAPLGDG